MKAAWLRPPDRATWYRRNTAGCYTRLQVLCPKWQGSVQEVLRFAADITADAPAGDPVAALPVAAHLEVAVEQRENLRRYFRSAQVHNQISRLADAWLESRRPHVRTAEAHHLFGAAFYLAGDLDRARRHLSELSRNSIPRTLPWLYLNRIPSSHYRVARLRAR